MLPYNRKHYKQRRQATVMDNVGGSVSKRYDCSEGNGFTQKIVKRWVKARVKAERNKRFTTRTEGAARKRSVDPCLDDVGLIT
jgi:hypothetical protein